MVAEESTKYRWPIIILALLLIGVIAYGFFKSGNQNPPSGSLTPSTEISAESPTSTPTSTPTPFLSPSAEKPYLRVSSQSLVNNQVNIDEAYLDKPGFVVMHQDQNGIPGTILAHSGIFSGGKENIKIAVNAQKAGTRVYAMLHYDADNNGVYNTADESAPVLVNDKAVVSPINITKAKTPTPTPKLSPTPKISPKAGATSMPTPYSY